MIPLPDYAHEFRPRWEGDDGGFNSAQMRAYAAAAVAAERERCAKLCETLYGEQDYWGDGSYFAEAIRGNIA